MLLVAELALPGKDHRDPVLIGGFDHLGIPNRATRLDDGGNTGGGVQITEHSAGVFGNATISNNTGTGVLVEQGSSLTTGGDTIANNTGDGLILNTLSALKFFSNDVMTASPGNLTLNCNNGSIVDGDVTIYKPKKCGAQFQAVPIH